jgi:hypothetical protein
MIPLWQVTTAHGITTLDRDGVNWHDAPLPRRWHRCRAQTIGVLDDGVRIDRCACGATGIDDGWIGRNESRRRR